MCNFRALHDYLYIIQELFLISFGKVSIVEIRFWKASFLEWSDTRNHLLLPRKQLYVHVYINRDQNQVLVSKSASLTTPLKSFFAANISTAFPPAYVNCFDVYFILLKILEVFTIKSCSVHVFHFIPSNEPSLHRTLFLSRKSWTEWDTFLGAPLLTSVKISLSERQLLYIVK